MASKYTYIFYHVDLDGMGIAILSLAYALNKKRFCKSKCCSYGTINSSVLSIINNSDIEEIIIGDLSVNESVAEELDKLYKNGIKVRLRDHHESALFLNKYEWAIVSEHDSNNISRSATWLLAQDEDFKYLHKEYEVLIDNIDEWDTWRWRQTNNKIPWKLNALFTVMGNEAFIDYIMSSPPAQYSEDLFTEKADNMIQAYFNLLNNYASQAESKMYTMNLYVNPNTEKFKTGIVFVNNHISEIGDIILTNHPELDILMLVVFPNFISWRTRKNLSVPLGTIAKLATGLGGGHPRAAGSSIASWKFQDFFTKLLDSSFDPQLDYSNFNQNKS